MYTYMPTLKSSVAGWKASNADSPASSPWFDVMPVAKQIVDSGTSP